MQITAFIWFCKMRMFLLPSVDFCLCSERCLFVLGSFSDRGLFTGILSFWGCFLYKQELYLGN